MHTKKLKRVLVCLCLILSNLVTLAQPSSAKNNDAFVDSNGILRWRGSNEEIHAFGVNYTMPFAYAYRNAKRLNIDIEKAIDNDIYHFARLGFDAYRVHVWDSEISDTLGNLLQNDHLKLFDYTLMKLKERGMKFIITPIAYWGNGFPEPDEKTPGFSSKYGKANCLTNPEAIKAQEKYLYQFLNHVNSYTGIAYKDEPGLIAFEICNEPHHNEAPEKVTAFVDRMVKSMRKTGCKKPILYNISHSIHLVDAYFKAGIQGGTFQWYPTGLGSRHELQGNMLPNVDDYKIPFSNNINFKKAAKIVYEFDAADVGRSYIYPAMARSFRTAGMQIATHFAYDPTFTAYANTEYSTHYMNLVYAPQKALSLKIASEVFHSVPLYKSFGQYPDNTTFNDFHFSYENDLAELVSETKFFYTNSTNAHPKNNKIEQIAGYGNSELVKYEGTGAYFLDRIEKGVWRLEVMPDALWVNDPFGRTSLKKEVAVVNWREWPMTIDLPELGENFKIKSLTGENNGQANSKTFSVTPGAYLIINGETPTNLKGDEAWKNIKLNEFFAPATTLHETKVLHEPLQEIHSNESYTVKARIVSKEIPKSVEVYVFGMLRRPEVIAMKRISGYDYEASIPAEFMKEGFLKYYIAVKENNLFHTYPSGTPNCPSDWDFFSNEAYEVKILSKAAPIYIFDALHDSEELSRQWMRHSLVMPLAEPDKAELLVNVDKLFVPDAENRNGEVINDYSFRYPFKNKIEGRKNDMPSVSKIIFKGRALNDKPCQLQLALVMKDGSSFGAILSIQADRKDYELKLVDLKKVKLVTLPRPYPTFLPYYFSNNSETKFDINEVESIQFSIGPGIPTTELNDKHGLAIESVRLE